MTEIAESVTLIGRDLAGRTASWEVKGDQLVDLPGSALVTQRVRARDDTMLIRRSLRSGSDDPAFLFLDNEIRALARLSRAFPEESARPFPMLVGYDMDSRDPWALVGDYRGQPARAAASGLLGADQTGFVTRLFDALARLALVEVVHNGLSLDGMYLNGKSLSIVNLERASFTGEPRPNRSGPGAQPRDDILDAGLLLYQLFTGEPAESVRPDLSEVPQLRTRLADLFADSAQRPSAADVLRRYDLPVPELPAENPLAAGSAAFDAARAAKYPASPTPRRTQQAPEPPRRRGFWSKGGLALLMSLLMGGQA